MIAVIQRVSESSVSISGHTKASIHKGLMVLVGIVPEDNIEDIQWLCRKIVQLRVFPDEQNIMNKSIKEVSGEILVVSQFTLHASTKKGNRPSYIHAAPPEIAIPLYDQFLNILSEQLGKPVASGEFGANMQVSLINNGPVTLIIDTKNKK